jgi:hypothetical protein
MALYKVRQLDGQQLVRTPGRVWWFSTRFKGKRCSPFKVDQI